MIKLDIPYRNQHENKVANDCGPACCAMAAGITVDDALARLNRPAAERNKPTVFGDLIRILHSCGIDSTFKRPYYLAQIRENLAAGRPSILLAHYDMAVEKPERPFPYSHFFLAVGYDDSGIIVHDSNWAGDGGAYLRLGSERLTAAMRSPGWGNMPFQGLVVERVYSFLETAVPAGNGDNETAERLAAELEAQIARADRAVAVLDQIGELLRTYEA